MDDRLLLGDVFEDDNSYYIVSKLFNHYDVETIVINAYSVRRRNFYNIRSREVFRYGGLTYIGNISNYYCLINRAINKVLDKINANKNIENNYIEKEKEERKILNKQDSRKVIVVSKNDEGIITTCKIPLKNLPDKDGKIHLSDNKWLYVNDLEKSLKETWTDANCFPLTIDRTSSSSDDLVSISCIIGYITEIDFDKGYITTNLYNNSLYKIFENFVNSNADLYASFYILGKENTGILEKKTGEDDGRYDIKYVLCMDIDYKNNKNTNKNEGLKIINRFSKTKHYNEEASDNPFINNLNDLIK